MLERSEADETVAACFERIAATHPGRPALISDHWQPTYAELNATANRFAHAIMARGGASDDRVAILMQHDAPALAAAVAVFKAGRILVGLNPTHPPGRLRELIEDSEPSIIVTDASLRSVAIGIAGPRCAVIDFEAHGAQGADHNPPIVASAGQVAMLTYTSGTTGRPKGVMKTHRQFRRTVLIYTEAMGYNADDRIPLFGSIGTGQGMTVCAAALLNGAALCPFPVIVRGVTGLAGWMTRRGVTVYSSSASIFRNFMKTLEPEVRFTGVRAVWLSSESATSDDYKQFRLHFPDDCWLVHTLSSTETSNIAWSRRLPGDAVTEGRLAIGKLSWGHEVSLVDEEGKPVPAGAVGEIVVGGRYIAAGYWRNPELTAERFSGDLTGDGPRQFRTGDLGRINADGLLEFCGRRDDQVKIRGNRIELSEIEQALQRLAGIERAAVEAVPREGRDPLLVGFVSIRGEQVWSQPELRRALRAVLPDHMVPSEFAILESLPLTPTGKIDREKLRKECRPRREPQVDEQPKTETESLLAGIWGELFDLDDIGRHHDFFALGGDSLTAAVVAARVHDALSAELNLAAFADHPTLKELASVVDRLRAEGASDGLQLRAEPRTEPPPMSSWQERIWNSSQTPADSAAYARTRSFLILGPLDVGLLRDCMNDLVRRHEILRTTFAVQDGRPVQIIHPPSPAPLAYTDLAAAPDANAQAELILRKEAAFVFDLAQGPLVRFALVRLRDNEYRLLRVGHHIISDGATWRLYFKELAALYEAKWRRTARPFPEVATFQYADYAVWQQAALSPDRAAYQRAVAWWKDNLLGAPPVVRLPFQRPVARWKSYLSEAPPVLRLPLRRAAAWWKDNLSKSPPNLQLPFRRVERQADAAPAGGVVHLGVERRVSHRLNALAPAHAATRLMVRLAAFVALLADETGEPDVVIGIYMVSRNRLPLHNMLGHFSNLVPLRFRCDSNRSFVEWLAIVRGQVLDAEAHSEIPYDTLVDELRRAGRVPPRVSVIFHVTGHQWTLEFAGIRMVWSEPQRQVLPWGFTLTIDDQNEEEAGPEGDSTRQEHSRVEFDPRIYDASGVRPFAARYKRLLDAVAQHPDSALSELLATSRG